MVNSNIAIDSLPTLQILLGIVALFEKIYDVEPKSEKCIAARHYAIICKQLLISNGRNRVRWVVLGLSEDGACTDLFEKLSVKSLKGDLSNATTFNPPLFSLVNTFKWTKTTKRMEPKIKKGII